MYPYLIIDEEVPDYIDYYSMYILRTVSINIDPFMTHPQVDSIDRTDESKIDRTC